ncbi:MAG: phage scaffolding protein [Roseburia sp.]|nr:phage scaffolding protein [Roseburia sp.]
MKNEDLEALGLSKEQVEGVLKLHQAEHDPVVKELETVKNDLAAEQEKVSAQEKTIKTLKVDLEGFKDVDVSGLQKKISDLEEDIKTKDANYQKEIADRDFADILKESISAAHGVNAKAITALLDVDTLKASKNQKEDIAAALEKLSQAEDSKMLFGGAASNAIGTGSPIGNVGIGSDTAGDDAQMRAIMGLPPEKGDK